MADLHLALKAIYFDQIRSGEKPAEYRVAKPYWIKRLEGREYDNIILTRGYPKRGDPERTEIRPWRGCKRITIDHPEFGSDPIEVFAIRVN